MIYFLYGPDTYRSRKKLREIIKGYRDKHFVITKILTIIVKYYRLNVIMKYSVIIRKSKYGYDVHAPALPGCHSQGDTEKEALENIRDAIRTYLGMERDELKGAKVREVEIAFA